jgi:hypothetical protein
MEKGQDKSSHTDMPFVGGHSWQAMEPNAFVGA